MFLSSPVNFLGLFSARSKSYFLADGARSSSGARQNASQKAAKTKGASGARGKGRKDLTILNRSARHNYQLFDQVESGLVLTGTEVKSIRAGQCQLKDSWCQFKDGELWLVGAHISPYDQGNCFNPDPVRDRKLLLHRRELNKLFTKVTQQGFTIVPTKLYFRRGKVKVEIALAQGKKLYDKRDSLKAAALRRDFEQEYKRTGSF